MGPDHALLKGPAVRGLRAVLLGVLALGSLTACPAFFIDRGELVAPAHDNGRPSVQSLPGAATYPELQDRWRREAQIGAAGAVVGTLREPNLVAAEVAHNAAVQSLDRDATRDLLVTTWTNAFGADLDRFSIDLDWRFDEQFVSHPEVLDPSNWTFILHVDERQTYAPIAVATLAHGQVPVQHFWEGSVRLWFPWKDHQRDRILLAGGTRVIRLELRHPSGTTDLTWRFRSAY